MNYFLAVNDRQLGTCLRMLFAEKTSTCCPNRVERKGQD